MQTLRSFQPEWLFASYFSWKFPLWCLECNILTVNIFSVLNICIWAKQFPALKKKGLKGFFPDQNSSLPSLYPLHSTSSCLHILDCFRWYMVTFTCWMMRWNGKSCLPCRSQIPILNLLGFLLTILLLSLEAQQISTL